MGIANSLTNQLLIAMPTMADPRFTKSVIFVCVHNEDGAMGLIINKLADGLTFDILLKQLKIDPIGNTQKLPIHFGGPVETGRGFVLHSSDYIRDGTIEVSDEVSLTATIDILQKISKNNGPKNFLVTLGYAGWGAGQLDAEMQQNSWLHVPPDEDLVFGPDINSKWESAITKIGIDLSLLSAESGHA